MRKLDELQVLEPCQADWDQFAGGDKVRFCSTCGKNVYNLSAMSRGVAERSLRRTGGTICNQIRAFAGWPNRHRRSGRGSGYTPCVRQDGRGADDRTGWIADRLRSKGGDHLWCPDRFPGRFCRRRHGDVDKPRQWQRTSDKDRYYRRLSVRTARRRTVHRANYCLGI